MPCSLGSLLLPLLHFVFVLAAGHEELSDTLPFLLSQQGSDQSVVHPVKTSAEGDFISHRVSHHFTSGRRRRDLQGVSPQKQVYYQVHYKCQELKFNLTTNEHLISEGYVLERRDDGASKQSYSEGNSCHLIGTVEVSGVRGVAAISTCKGLRGFFSLPEGHFFIEPAQQKRNDSTGAPEPHIIYPGASAETFRKKRSVPSEQTHIPCGVQDAPSDSIRAEREREEWEREQRRVEAQAQPRTLRSVSRERWVETMVVADSKLIEYHGSDNVESYIFTIMNMVTGIFHDASIGNAIHVILVRLILLQGEEKGLKIVHNADTTLATFCAWQKNLNPQSDTHPAHHDLAVLISRKDFCAGMNQPCETLGLSHLSGMCQPHRSCNINEDSGLPVAFTVAHEMGHSFGIHHDGQGNDCELQGRHPFIMSRQLMYDTSPLTWSSCSKEYITRFLDRGWGFCLDDRPSKRDIATPLARLGVRYTTHHQCQLQYGQNATFCPEVDNVCQILWCSVNGSCRSKLDSPIDGTRCGPEKWCISGECVIVGKLPETVNGGWGQWSTWSYCSRTCGTGVQSAERECNNPKPEFGGKYCTGERKRYRTCNTKPCQSDKPTFREMLCSEFDTVPYHNELYQWIPVYNPSNPCELHCQPVGEYFSERMFDIVTDGTPCFMNNRSRNICVNGVCKEVGCDYGIESNAEEDPCGVCLGDGTTCQTVSKSFDQGEEFGYVDVGVIPEGARDVVVKEVVEAGNFLALKSVESDKYFLNGNFIIQWNGEYEAAGATFHYERHGNMENLTARGPTKQPLMLQLLVQEKNPGITYQYIIKKAKDYENEITEPIYIWKHGAWTACSSTCGLGEQHQPARCFQMGMGVVDESLCDQEGRLQDNHRKCKNMECPARWWVGGWQQCTATCGSSGVRKRTVLCVRTMSGEERVLHPVECKQFLKPKPVVPCNRDVPCGHDWVVSDWQECTVTCGGGVRSRTVSCALVPGKPCDLSTKPRSRSLCGLQSCPNSNFHRRPGTPPTSRRVFLPKTVSPVDSDTTPASPTTKESKTTMRSQTTLPPVIETIIPEIIDADDFMFNVVVSNKNNVKNNTETSHTKKHRERTFEGEEGLEEDGSTPSKLVSTPRNDYVLVDAEASVGDVEISTPATTLWSFPPSTTSKPQYRPVSTHRTRKAKPTTHPTSFTSPEPLTKKRQDTTSSSDQWTHRAHLTTPSYRTRTDSLKTGVHTERAPPMTPRRPSTTRASFHPAPMIPAKKENSSQPQAPNSFTKSKVNQPRGSNSNQRTPKSGSSGGHSKLTAREPVSRDVFWIVGNWSECSTTCGIGAVWRTVVCSSQNDDDCARMKKPEPARTCHLQPCAMWQASGWTKCADDCGLTKRRYREVQCLDTQSKRPLRPFHCQAVSSRPATALVCPHRACMNWSVSPWGPCSSSCGEGTRERLVFCAEPHRCSVALKPNSTELCILRLCTHWKTGEWEECSATCGGGQQLRTVKCENDSAVMPHELCEDVPKPETLRKCNKQECKFSSGCRKNTMSSRFCEKLKLLGRCTLRSVQKQCCATCRP